MRRKQRVVTSHNCKRLFYSIAWFSLLKISLGEAYSKLLRGLLFNCSEIKER